MKGIFKGIIGAIRFVWQLLLFLIAWALTLPGSLINFFIVVITSEDRGKDYFISSAANLDMWANREFRTLWNLTLIKSSGYKFGLVDETISSVLGKNKLAMTLSIAGKVLAWILDSIERNHCIKSINHQINW